jgi:hypothetical protein
MPENDRPLIDPEQSACLCRAGAPGYAAVTAVDRNGVEQLWLVCEDMLDHPEDATGGDPDQAHEQVGRLPYAVRERIWGDQLRCGRPTVRGTPCRQRVQERGQACAAHCCGHSCGKCRSCHLGGVRP